ERLREKRAALSEPELAELEELLKQLEMATEELRNRSDLDQKRALIEVNEMTKLVAEKREKLSGSEEMRKQFSKLRNIQKGPGDQLARAMQRGDLGTARDQLEKLKEQLESGELGEQDREALERQLTEMQEKLREVVKAFEAAK